MAKDRLAGLGRLVRRQAQFISLGRYNPLLISDGQGWILDDLSRLIVQNLPEAWRGRVIDAIPRQVVGKALHFVERYRFSRLEDPAPLCERNHVIVTWWHGGASGLRQIHLDGLLDRVPDLARLPLIFHITSSLYENVLLNLGVARELIVRVPLGIERGRFTMRAPSRAAYKTLLGIPEDRVCIGFFQRDGDEEPKLVKGPDVFVDVISRLWSERDDLYVLLTGLKRGYVMRHLDQLGVPYKYTGWVPAGQMAAHYFASDLYLITSREEGGPAAVLECMATGTPLIATRVGMAVDVIEHGENGFLAAVEDRDALAGHALALIRDQSLRRRLAERALETAKAYDWQVIAPQYARALYTPAG